LVDLFCKAWGEGQTWENKFADGPHEANFLKLDCSRLKSVFDWKPRWDIFDAVAKTVEWTRVYLSKGDICNIMDKQILEFLDNGVQQYV